MKLARVLVLSLAVAVAPAAMSQNWEIGGGVGGGFYTSQDVTLSGASAAAKIHTNVAGSAWLDNDIQVHWAGELRYDYQLGALALSSGGTHASFGAASQAFHYDLLWRAAPNGSKIRPFLGAGAGIKMYQGNGTEVVYQPLSQFALLTKAQDLTPLVSAGGGVKIQLTPRMALRLEVHDFLTPFPKQVIVPNQGAKAGGWLQDFVPMAGLSVRLGKGE